MKHDLNILMIFGIKYIFFILTHTMLAISTNIPSDLRMRLCSRVTNRYFTPSLFSQGNNFDCEVKD